MSKVSVIIPCYNSAATVSETLQSVLAQDYPDVEIICVNDGSTDNTLGVLKKISAENPGKIQVLSIPNGGGSVARNAGFSYSTGQYIQYLDADDCIVPDKLSAQVKLFDDNTDMVVSDYEQRDYTLQYVLKTIELPEAEKQFFNATINKIISTPNPLYRRGLVEKAGGYREDLRAAQDWDFHLRISILKPKVKYLPKIVAYARVVQQSVSSDFGKVIVCCGISLVDNDKKIYDAAIDEAVKQRVARYYYEASLYDTDKARVTKYLRNLQRWDPALLFLAPSKRKMAKTMGLRFMRSMDRLRFARKK